MEIERKLIKDEEVLRTWRCYHNARYVSSFAKPFSLEYYLHKNVGIG